MKAVFAHIGLIVIVTCVIAAIFAAMLLITGSVTDEQNIPDIVRYGDPVLYSAEGVLSPLSLEYGVPDGQGNMIWSDRQPVMPGSYSVRTVTKGLFGGTRYRKTHDFSIVPRKLLLEPEEGEFVWGSEPTVKADTVYGDTLQSYSLKWGNMAAETTGIGIEPDSVVIISDLGVDVTYAYELDLPVKQVRILPAELTVTIKEVSFTYDGKPHSCDKDQETAPDGTPLSCPDYYEITAGGMIDGDRLSAVFDAQLTDAGEVENKPVFHVLRNGEDVTLHYTIQVIPGTLTVTKRPLTIETETSEREYDGNPVTYRGITVSEDAQPAEGQHVEADFITLTDVGTTENLPVIRVLDEDGVDRTDNYALFIIPGTLTVTPKPLRITTDSAVWTYDATVHAMPEVLVDGLADGHIWKECSAPELTDVGRMQNTREIVVLDAAGQDVTSNYAVTTEFGTLEVTPLPVTVRTPDGTWVYDGVIHEAPDVSVSELPEGHVMQLGEVPQLREAGQAENSRGTVILDADGRDVTHNYDITTAFGRLEVTPRPLSVTTPSETWEYDGCVHSAPDVNIEGLADGHTARLDDARSLQNVGTAENGHSIAVLDADGQDVTANYEITTDFGTLEITPRPLVVNTNSNSWVYDSYEHEETGFKLGDGTTAAPDEKVLLSDTPAILHAGSVSNDAVCRVIRSDGTDATSNYQIKLNPGTLTVTKRPVSYSTSSKTWTYDGESYQVTGYNLLSTLQIAVNDTLEGRFKTFRDAGVYENSLEDGWYIRSMLTDEDVTRDYDITFTWGKITVNKRKVTVTSASVTKEYDGTPLEAPDFTVISPITWAAGDRPVDGTYPSITDAGSIINQPDSLRVYRDADSPQPIDVTNNYDLTFKWGKLTVTRRPVTLKALDAEKIYDDLPLTTTVAVAGLSPRQIVAGEVLTAEAVGSQTDAGTKTATVNPAVKVTKADGSDSTGNYLFTFESGKLTVNKRPIIVESVTRQKKYDGKALTDKTCQTAPDSPYPLVSGHTLTATITGTQTKIGSSPNTIKASSVKVLNVKKADVTKNYDILSVNTGTLTVLPAITITVSTGSASKPCDGTPLVCNEYSVESDGAIPSGYKVLVTVTGSIVEPGTAPNTASVKVVNVSGKDVTNEYTILTKEGKLTISQDQSLAGYGLDSESLIGEMTATSSGPLYLRQFSYSDYTGTGWRSGTPYGKTLPGGVSYNLLTSIALRNSGQYELQTAVFTNMSLFMLPCYIEQAPGCYTPDDDVYYTDTLSDYTAVYYDADDLQKWNSLKNQLGEYAAYEAEYRAFVYPEYTRIDQDTADWLRANVIDVQHFDASDPTIINQVAAFVRSAAEYNLNYDVGLDASTNVIIDFLSTYKEGVCRHYASATTLILRALGIPARYVEGFYVVAQKDELTEIKTPGHAWCEAYVDGLGWIIVDSTPGDCRSCGGESGSGSGGGSGGESGSVSGGGSGGGSGEGSGSEAQEITIRPVFRSKVYDGTPLYAPAELDYDPVLNDLIQNGYTYSVTIKGEQTVIGDGISSVTDFRLYDPLGNDVTESARYSITKENGVLRVSGGEIRVFPYQISKYYDGTPLTFDPEDFDFLQLPDGLQVMITPLIEEVNVCRYSLSDMNTHILDILEWKILLDGQDVSDKFMLVFDVPDGIDRITYCPYEIRQCEIELTSESVTKLYDGEALSSSKVWISKGYLAAGDTLYAKTDSHITDPGFTINSIPDALVMIINRAREDVTKNYKITLIEGILTVLPSE